MERAAQKGCQDTVPKRNFQRQPPAASAWRHLTFCPTNVASRGRSGLYSKPLAATTTSLKPSCTAQQSGKSARRRGWLVCQQQPALPGCCLPRDSPCHTTSCLQGQRTWMAQSEVGTSALPGIIGGGSCEGVAAPSASCLPGCARAGAQPAAAPTASSHPSSNSAVAFSSREASSSAMIWWPRSLGCVLQQRRQARRRG